MQPKVILFHTADGTPTEGEAADIAALRVLSEKPYTLKVVNGKPRAKRAATTLSAATADHSINDSANGLRAAGFRPGDVVTVRGFTGAVACNVENKTIATVTAGKMTFVGTTGDAIVNDAAGETVTIETVDTALHGTIPITADYLAGTIPASYRSAGEPIYPVFDIDNPPEAPTLPATQTVLSDAEEVDLDTAGTVTFAVEDGEITAAELASDEAVVTDGDTLALGAHEVTATVAENVVTGLALPATKVVVADTEAIPLGTHEVTATVAAGVITGVDLPATKVVVAHEQVIAVTGGGSVALTVAGGEITGCAYTAP